MPKIPPSSESGDKPEKIGRREFLRRTAVQIPVVAGIVAGVRHLAEGATEGKVPPPIIEKHKGKNVSKVHHAVWDAFEGRLTAALQNYADLVVVSFTSSHYHRDGEFFMEYKAVLRRARKDEKPHYFCKVVGTVLPSVHEVREQNAIKISGLPQRLKDAKLSSGLDVKYGELIDIQHFEQITAVSTKGSPNEPFYHEAILVLGRAKD